MLKEVDVSLQSKSYLQFCLGLTNKHNKLHSCRNLETFSNITLAKSDLRINDSFVKKMTELPLEHFLWWVEGKNIIMYMLLQ